MEVNERGNLHKTPKIFNLHSRLFVVITKCNHKSMVEMTGLEPAASASRTQRSTKLSHATILLTRIASTLK